jgi:asparagine synthase (glutamine-hydrolysing)
VSLIISHNDFAASKKCFGFYYNDELFVSFDERYSYFLKGELYGGDISDLVNIIKCKNHELISDIDGEYSCIFVDKTDGSIYIINDKTGRDTIFYSEKQGLSVSDDIWDLVYHLDFKLEDIDSLSLKCQVFLFSDPSYNTFIKGINILPNAIVASYSSSKFLITKYWWFAKKENCLTVAAKMDMLDTALNFTFKRIRNTYSESTSFGVGISGGLDSRLIPYFCKKHKIPLNSFIIGEQKPNKILISNDHCRSQEIVDHFNLKNTLHEYNDTNIKIRLRKDAVYAPIASSQLFKMPNMDKVNFDILITGGSGYIVGSSPFYSKSKYPDVVDMILERQSALKKLPKFYRYKKGLNHLFGKIFKVT